MLAPALVLALLAATPAPAAAPVYRSATDGFAIPLGGPGPEQVCVVRPAALRDAAGCEGLDASAVDAHLADQVVAMSILRFPEYGVFMQVLRLPQRLTHLDASAMREFLRGVKQATDKRFPGTTTRGLTAGADFDPVTTGAGRTVYGFVQALPAGANEGNDRILTYVALSGERAFTVLVETPEASLGTVAPLVQGLVTQMELAPESPAPDPAYALGEAAGRLVGMMVVLGVVFTLVNRWLRRRREAANAPGAPAP